MAAKLLRTMASRQFMNCASHSHPGHFVPKNGDRVVVAMSGGVDSSVTARLLADQDYDLSAVFMRNWDTRDESGTDRGCEWEKDWEDVQHLCRKLGLPCEMIDLSRDYWNRVFEPSLQLWERGETPNPDVWCNREIKFGSLMNRLFASSVGWVATGHYAGIDWDVSTDNPRPKLMRALHRRKDQTYYLSAVHESSLRKTLFPLRNLSKESVRELAQNYALPTASREESMGICFVGEKRKFDQFISGYIQPQIGSIVDGSTGKRIGTHNGLWQYTIGQGAKIPGMRDKMFVSKKDVDTNEIFVVPGTDHPALYCDGVITRCFNWIWENSVPSAIDSADGFHARVQYRHKMDDIPCVVKRRPDGNLKLSFQQPEKAVATGQIAAVYDSGWCLGSGIITETTASL